MTLLRSWFSFPSPLVSSKHFTTTPYFNHRNPHHPKAHRPSKFLRGTRCVQYFFNMSKGANLTANDMNLAAARVGFHRLRFEEGYVFRTKANSLEELTQIACSHYWWGEDKPSADEIRLTTKSRRGKVFYLVEAAGYPKNINTADDF